MIHLEKLKAILIGGTMVSATLFVTITGNEFWPVSNYPLFSSYPHKDTILWPKVLNENNEILNQDDDFWPLDSFRYYAITQDLIFAGNHNLSRKLIHSLYKAQRENKVDRSRLKGRLVLMQSVWNVSPGFTALDPIQEHEVFTEELYDGSN